ncbi:DNA-directed RNA polymerase I subunit 2 [Aristolochia californica]|uniref:DNA-directed RNA polymerase I subunit 2 n=1 Tax=Aristolochia californica TaxID=171875 RepID=UPI0035E359DA
MEMDSDSNVSNLEKLQELVRPHIDSFDYFIDTGLDTMLLYIRPVQIIEPSGGIKLRVWFEKAILQSPEKVDGHKSMHRPLLPNECRQAGLTYHGKLFIHVCFQYNDGAVVRETFNFGNLPIMLKSKLCHLRGADSQKLVAHKEEAMEMGGYFICGGLERLVRILIMPKRNYPMAVIRSGFKNRHDGFTDKGIIIRCVREDQSSVTLRLYYLQNGSARLGFSIKAREYLLPIGVVLKALKDTSDREIFLALTSCHAEKHQRGKGAMGSQLVGERAKIIVDEVKKLSLLTHQQCLNHIGKHFRTVMDGLETESHSVVGKAVLREYILVHLRDHHDKFNLLTVMLQKLFATVDQNSVPDNPDTLQYQEVLLPGHLVTLYLKEKLQEWLFKCRQLLTEEIQKANHNFDFYSLSEVKKVMHKSNHRNIGKSIESMLKTGKLVTATGLDLQQRDGMTIQAERLNFLRFISHFQSVHRGAYFTTMRTTTVRKLLPESWGFLCPVHTPDGEPCGLLNHLTSTCRITSCYESSWKLKDFIKIRTSVVNVLVGMGMTPSLPKLDQAGPPDVLYVLLDGCVIGSISSSLIDEAVSHIRRLKLLPTSGIPEDLEVGYVPVTIGGAYPGLYMFTSPSRFVRPVRNLSHLSEGIQDIELIGPFEQAFMEIKCADGGDGGRSHHFPATHEEIHPTGMLSVVANLTPWSDHNQSPRNMYQCQMAKQTMAFSAQALQYRADKKLYHLQTPQTPIVRTKAYTRYCMDEYPAGTNAIVAVLAYTGYDMEDAMILNKSSVERGMCHGYIYQVDTVDVTNQRGSETKFFRRSNIDKSVTSSIDSDGLPFVGQMIQPRESYCSIYNETSGTTKTMSLKGSEPVIVDSVSVDGVSSKNCVQKVDVRFRRLRNPVIGDKFSSRHGQKGVCSQLWPDIDMPFSGVTGMRPDLIINPHAFPSRMTIGMLLESIAAKGGSLHGKFVDATPFPGSDNKGCPEDESSSLVDELGHMLASKGFNYHGSEVLYSGVLGTELACEIFVGPVYYQRLRHMVSDKFQVRSTGTVDPLTKQPIKGRKAGGGIRFGEMERDSVLAHGAAYLLHDRLHICSDYHIADVCSLCGSILSASVLQQQKRAVVREIAGLPPVRATKKVICHACKTSKGMETVALPYVFRYLAAELAAMNIKMTLKLCDGAESIEA